MGRYSDNPDRCQVCGLAAPYWKNIPVRSRWFFGIDKSIYCPDHLPEWVIPWRESKRDE